jgi:ribonucleoside-triphosphate reductase
LIGQADWLTPCRPIGPEIATTKDRSLRDQIELAALIQKHWADNQVSCTVTFDPDHEAPLLVPILREFDSQLKGISFLPRLKHGAFAQMPYEAIDQATYEAMYSKLKPLDLSAVYTPKPVAEVAKKGGGPRKHIGVELPSSPDSFCDADSCERL